MLLTSHRRFILGALALAMLAAPSVSSGCAGSFDPASKVNSLRILAVTADKPYAAPGETVTFRMTVSDPTAQILWLGACFDPVGDQYFACYEPLAKLAQSKVSGAPPPENASEGEPGPTPDTWNLELWDKIIDSRPKPDVGPHYGIAYVFFAACAGTFGLVPAEATGKVPDFPLGCFDTDGNQLGPESFVPGYTQIYSFADGRSNENPPIGGLTLNGEPIVPPTDFENIPSVKACPLTEDERRATGCAAEQSKAECKSYTIKALFEPSVAQIDPDATGGEGEQLTEAVWVSYFAEGGEISPGIILVNDPVSGFNPDVEVSWLPPAAAGVARLWAVVRDARGGSSVVERFVRVE